MRFANKEDNGILDERSEMLQEADEKNRRTRGKFRGKILWDVIYFLSFLGNNAPLPPTSCLPTPTHPALDMRDKVGIFKLF